MIFVDSNVPMYLIGAEHPNRATARRVLERIVVDEEPTVTSAEVFQEILHRYTALQRPDAVPPAFDVLRGLADAVFDIGLPDVDRARQLVLEVAGMSARDALHIAVMEREGIDRIFSFDRGFDRIEGLTRVFD